MAFDTIEQSEHSGEPIVLVRFTIAGVNYGYTPNQLAEIYLGLQYNPLAALEIERLVQSANLADNETRITLPFDSAVAQLYRTLPPQNGSVDIYTRHYGDSEYRQIFRGEITAADFNQYLCSLTVASELALLRTLGLRRTFSRRCQHQLYDQQGGSCRVDPNAFKATGTIAAIGSGTVTVVVAGSQADGYYTAGMIRRVTNSDYRFIVGHGGQVLTLYAPFSTLAVSDSVEIFAGCDHTLATCASKFNNAANCGCWPGVPLRNPVTQKIA